MVLKRYGHPDRSPGGELRYSHRPAANCPLLVPALYRVSTSKDPAACSADSGNRRQPDSRRNAVFKKLPKYKRIQPYKIPTKDPYHRIDLASALAFTHHRLNINNKNESY